MSVSPTVNTGSLSFTSPTLIVTSVVSVLLSPSVAVTVTEYAFDDAADPGVS